MDKEKTDRFEITEMFMAQASHERCFYGIIKRGTDEFGNDFVFSRIVMPDGLIQARANDQQELGKNLDEICRMVLDYGLHNNTGANINVLNTALFVN
jgi:hypothetical protein